MGIISQLFRLFGYKIVKVNNKEEVQGGAKQEVSSVSHNTESKKKYFPPAVTTRPELAPTTSPIMDRNSIISISNQAYLDIKNFLYNYDYDNFKAKLEEEMAKGFSPGHVLNHRKYGGKYENLLIATLSYQFSVGEFGTGNVTKKGEQWLKIIQLLLDKNVDPNFVDADGKTPLFYAVKPISVGANKASFEAFKLLLASPYIDINKPISDGRTPLLLALNTHNRNRTKMIEMLIDAGADITIRDKDGNNALFYTNDSKIVRKLLQAGLDVNSRNNNGGTPLLKAACSLHRVKFWTDLGADINAKDKDGNGILHYCLSNSNPNDFIPFPLSFIGIDQAVKYLATLMPVDTRNNDGETPLITFSRNIKNKLNSSQIRVHKNEIQAVLKELAKANADFSVQDDNGRTAIEYFAQAFDLKSVKFCVAQGVDINKGTQKTPFEILCDGLEDIEAMYVDTDIAKYFTGYVTSGADVDSTLFLLKASNCNFICEMPESTLKKVIDDTSDLERKDRDGKTALDNLLFLFLDLGIQFLDNGVISPQRRTLLKCIRLMLDNGAECHLDKIPRTGISVSRYNELISYISTYKTVRNEIGLTSTEEPEQAPGYDYEI